MTPKAVWFKNVRLEDEINEIFITMSLNSTGENMTFRIRDSQLVVCGPLVSPP